ncbi:helix-turn-helix transcriptional regulator [Clostridium magnum]|uniref:HTH cro/C1-type domain-containing protein n=1 Tax=Clostridium magnum DSM 2767 TaxID=1121326 RepID=A0A162QL56_9CLOT|nr:helix-turn-helix transcriptional regulator [Clostridium magnum]KZL88663.1 hypothetical protein CLMAG_59520 [Clostridium magnum DSM 2767]KZL88753.1 hypothetical protein CLMAG_60420 [Clostridium magnum DSM 2767]SHJ60234.1 hypothetical protein SAMN02745944_06214 [Clostridium magnum DSM 2767]
MNLREFRYIKGLQRQFVASKVGICGKHLNDIESGRVNLTVKVKQKLSDLYKTDEKDIESMYKEVRNEKERDTIKTKSTSSGS